MKRELKFRAWDKTGKQYVSAGIVTQQQIPVVPTEHGFMLKSKFILQEWTGKFDQGNVEIYEGDVVEAEIDQLFERVKKIGLIEYKNGQWMIDFPDEGVSIGIDGAEYLYVIGNEFEHPLALKKGKYTKA